MALHENVGDASIFRTSWLGTDASIEGTAYTQTQEFAAEKAKIQAYVDEFNAVSPEGYLTEDEYHHTPSWLISKESAGKMFQDSDGWYKILSRYDRTIRFEGDDLITTDYIHLYWFDSLDIAKRYRGMWQANCVGIRMYHDDDEYREAEILGSKSALEALRKFCETAAEPCEIRVSDITDSSSLVSNKKWPSFSIGIGAVRPLKRDDLSKLPSGAPSHNTMEDGAGRGWWQMSMIKNCWAGLIDDYDAGISEVWISTADKCPPGMTPWFCNEDSSGNFIPVKKKLIGRYAGFHDWDISGDPDTMKSYASQQDSTAQTVIINNTPVLCCAGSKKWSRQWNYLSRFSFELQPLFSCKMSVWEYTVLGALFTAYYGTQKHYMISSNSNAYTFGAASQSTASWIIPQSQFQYYNSSETLTNISSDWTPMKPSGLSDAVASQHVISRGGLGVLSGDSFPGIGVMTEYLEKRSSNYIVNTPGMFMFIENPSSTPVWLSGAVSWKKLFAAGTSNGISLPDNLEQSWYSDMTAMTISSNRSNGADKWKGLEYLSIKDDNPLARYQNDSSKLYEYRKRETLDGVDETAMMNIYFGRMSYAQVSSTGAAYSFNSMRMPIFLSGATTEPGTGAGDADSRQNHKEIACYSDSAGAGHGYRSSLFHPYSSQIVNNWRKFENSAFEVSFTRSRGILPPNGNRPVLDVIDDDKILPCVYVPRTKYSADFNMILPTSDVIIDIKFAFNDPTANQMLLEYGDGWNNSSSNIFRWVVYNYYDGGEVRSDLKDGDNTNHFARIYSPCDSSVHTVRIESYNGTLTTWHDGVQGGSAATASNSQAIRAYCLFGKTSAYYFEGWLYYVRAMRHNGELLYDWRPYKKPGVGVGLMAFNEKGIATTFLYDSSNPLYERKPYSAKVKYIDLGLPSGLLWAKGNIVKDSNGVYAIGEPTDYGCYFSWGNIIGHNAGDGYVFGTSNSGTYASTPGASVNTDISPTDADHDAALACLGNPWRLPTKENFQELYDNTDHEWTTINNVSGWKFMKKTDNSVYVFFPAAGTGTGTSIDYEDSRGFYWSSSRDTNSNAYRMSFQESNINPQYSYYKYRGNSIRAVRSSN